MATETLRPNAAGDETAIPGQYPATGSHYDKVDEATADDDATYVYIDETDSYVYRRDLYHLPAHSEGSGTINSVTVYLRDKLVVGNGGTYASIKTHATVYDAPPSAQPGTSYATVNKPWTTNPYTGSAWTWEEVDALQIGLKISVDNQAGAEHRCTQIYVEIDYTPIVAKQSSDSGSGAEALGSRIFDAAETGSGTGASSLLAALIGTGESGLGSEFAAIAFAAFDSGSGADAVVARLLAAAEAGSGVEAALLIAALTSGDVGTGADLSTLLKAILAADEGSGVEALKALIETSGPDMKLRARPGQVRIPFKGVNL